PLRTASRAIEGFGVTHNEKPKEQPGQENPILATLTLQEGFAKEPKADKVSEGLRGGDLQTPRHAEGFPRA
ncbi:hypothetical protein EJB05_22146, partial [Eragrostis curvula]